MYVYRLTLVPIILAVLVGVNLQIWKNARINYVFIFRFDPRDHLSVSQYIEMTMSLYNITMGSLIIYMYSIITNTFYEYAYLHQYFCLHLSSSTCVSHTNGFMVTADYGCLESF
ncbi:hypothetical protein FDP41_013327 [Naegleria fowleri]|uniref:EXS domain-containing protein n=1 Tax=Naegleria fowleri TaxID=5763 RepID=A0A6A5C2S4_NAEFO|nr:uncharacterized protein FDP41_013327 [Naegleria fowleri]KAF0980844.1 hypothetical protein FDP41_013327 [Naegleria fowleri]